MIEKDLTDIIDTGIIRRETQSLAGAYGMECVQDVNTMIYKVLFSKKK